MCARMERQKKQWLLGADRRLQQADASFLAALDDAPVRLAFACCVVACEGGKGLQQIVGVCVAAAAAGAAAASGGAGVRHTSVGRQKGAGF